MGWSENQAVKRSNTFSILQLKQHLIDIMENGHGVCVRFRMIGELWQQNFSRIVNVSENRVLITHEEKDQLISLDLRSVMQFEVDKKFKGLEPYFHYEVVPELTDQVLI